MLRKEIPVRSTSGVKWITNKTNKKHLRADFKGRCGYCDDLDNLCGGKNTYSVEHFAPKEKFPELKYVYDNLLYACPYCNSFKNDDWVGNTPIENIVGNRGYVDPCLEEFDKHLDRNDENGEIIYKTEVGRYMYEHLNLNLKRHSVLFMIEKLHNKIQDLSNSIDQKKLKGIDVTGEEKILSEFNRSFHEYYGILISDD